MLSLATFDGVAGRRCATAVICPITPLRIGQKVLSKDLGQEVEA
jgi:hypothetical protein